MEGNEMKKLFKTCMAILVGFTIVSTSSGCSKQKKIAADIESAVLKANSESDKRVQLSLLRSACDDFEKMKATWPDSKRTADVMTRQGHFLREAPARIYRLAIETKDIESFKWALGHSVDIGSDPIELKKVWGNGPLWVEFVMAKYAAQAFPTFLQEAARENSTSFFKDNMVAIQKSNASPPIEFSNWYAQAVEEAVGAKNRDAISHLLEYAHPREKVVRPNAKLDAAMSKLGSYLVQCKDGPLVLKLMSLGYTVDGNTLLKAGFDQSFFSALAAQEKNAMFLLGYIDTSFYSDDEQLSRDRLRVFLFLPEAAMAKANLSYIDTAINLCIKSKAAEDALRLIRIQDQARQARSKRSDITEYYKTFKLAVEYGNSCVMDYLIERFPALSSEIDFVKLANNYDCFAKYAPAIIKKGITPTIVSDVLASTNYEATLYIVQNYKWESWRKVTGRTELMDVCRGGNFPAAKYLVENKNADIKARTDYSEQKMTALGLPTTPEEGSFTPIMFASGSGNCELIQYLVDKGASVNDRSYFGATPLMFAAEKGRLEAVKLLISLGADVNAKMEPKFDLDAGIGIMRAYAEKSNAYRRARKNDHTAVVEVLEAAGARP